MTELKGVGKKKKLLFTPQTSQSFVDLQMSLKMAVKALTNLVPFPTYLYHLAYIFIAQNIAFHSNSNDKLELFFSPDDFRIFWKVPRSFLAEMVLRPLTAATLLMETSASAL